MLRNGVHGHRKGQQVTCRDEDDQKQLTGSEELPAKTTKEDLPGLRHALDVRKAPFELTDHVTGVCGQEA